MKVVTLSALRSGRLYGTPPTQEIFLILIFVRGWVETRTIVRPEGFYVNEKFQWINGNRSRDLPTCSAVHQQTAPPAACPNRNEYQENFLGVKAARAYGWQIYYIHVPIFLKSGSLGLLELSGPNLSCPGISLLLPFTLRIFSTQWKFFVTAH